MDEKIRHDKALEAYQADYAKYQKDRTELLDWIAEQDREKDKARYDFQEYRQSTGPLQSNTQSKGSTTTRTQGL